jgi:hypothetical protein
MKLMNGIFPETLKLRVRWNSSVDDRVAHVFFLSSQSIVPSVELDDTVDFVT